MVLAVAGAAAFALARPAAAATAPPPEQQPPTEVAAESDDAAGREARLRVPPIGFWGSLSYDLNAQDARSSVPDSADARTLQHLLTARIDGSTYVWEPWFGNVSAGIGATLGWFDASSTAAPTRDQFLTGRAQLNLFPASRFPFEAHVEVTDTRVDGGLIALSPARWTRAGLSQSYRPAGKPYTLFGRFEHVAQDNDTTGRDTQNTLDVNGEIRWKHHDLSVWLAANDNTRERSGEEARYASLVTRHTYAPSTEFSFESNANLTYNQLDGAEIDTRSRVLQYVGVGYWRPLQKPYTLTATARLFAFDTDDLGNTRNANVTLGGTYDANRNLRFTANAGLGALDAAGRTQLLYGVSGGAFYVGDTLAIGAFSYDWSTSGTLSWAGRSRDGVAADAPETDGDIFAATGTVGHTIGRTFPVGPGHTVAATLGQSLTAAKTTERVVGRDEAVRLANDFTVTYNAGVAPVSGYARLTLTDSRGLVRGDNVFQMANVQVSGTWEISRHSQLAADFTAQWVRIKDLARLPSTPGDYFETPTSTATSGIGGTVSYRHQRAFGVPRLRFLSELRATEDAVLEQDQRMLLPDREYRSWENRLDYTIGRLLLSLSLRLSEINQSRIALLLFRVQRDFEGVVAR